MWILDLNRKESALFRALELSNELKQKEKSCILELSQEPLHLFI